MSKIYNQINNRKVTADNIFTQQAPNSIAPNVLPGVKLGDLRDIKCKECGNIVFYPAHALKFASRFQSRNGMPTLVQVPLGFACTKCNTVNPFDKDAIEKGIDSTDQDGQKQKAQQEENNPGGDLGISVTDGTKASEKVG